MKRLANSLGLFDAKLLYQAANSGLEAGAALELVTRRAKRYLPRARLALFAKVPEEEWETHLKRLLREEYVVREYEGLIFSVLRGRWDCETWHVLKKVGEAAESFFRYHREKSDPELLLACSVVYATEMRGRGDPLLEAESVTGISQPTIARMWETLCGESSCDEIYGEDGTYASPFSREGL